MSYTYLFFRPKRLPLAPGEVNEDAVEPLADLAALKGELSIALPSLEWTPTRACRRQTADGSWLEFHTDGGTLALRCSLRFDHRPEVQRICDTLNWVAFDEQPLCYQPRRPPMSV